MGRIEEVNVALIGYGIGGAVFHAPLIAATPGFRLSVVLTRDAGRAAEARRRYGATIVESIDEIRRRAAEIDLVVVASPNAFHAAHARAAIDAGLSVVVDKPFALTVEEACSLVDAARAAGVRLSVFHNRRWDGDFRTVAALIAEGRLGTVHRFESRFERWRPRPKGGWREMGTSREGAGLLYDLGSHLVDQALVLFGPVRDVYAQVDRRRPEVAADDDVFLALTHVGGVRSFLWASSVASNFGPRFRILGSKAAYLKYGLDVQEEALRAGRRPDTEPDWGREERTRWGELGEPGATEPVETLPGCYQDFYRKMGAALRGEGPVPVDAGDAIEGLRILEAARRSHELGQVVHLEPSASERG